MRAGCRAEELGVTAIEWFYQFGTKDTLAYGHRKVAQSKRIFVTAINLRNKREIEIQPCRPVYEPARDLDWLDKFTEAARANALSSFATLEHIAHNTTDADMRNVAEGALNKIYAWQKPCTHTQEF